MHIDELLSLFTVSVAGRITKANYVYVYTDTNDVPFYVGLGSRDGVSYKYPRCFQHLAGALKGKNNLLARKLRKMKLQGEAIFVTIVANSDTREKMSKWERELIEEYGTRNEGGTLCNIAYGGDGGATVEHGSRKITDGSQTRILPPGRKLPKGWTYGQADTGVAKKTRCCYNPSTGQRCKIGKNDLVPKAYVEGQPKGVKTGPKGKEIWHNPKTRKMYWLDAHENKAGLVKGRSNKGSTSGRVAITNVTSGRVSFVERGASLPKGYKRGQPGKPSTVKGSSVWHDPTDGKIVYVAAGKKPPKGYLSGRPKRDTVEWAWYHDPTSSRLVQIPLGEKPPKGYKKGRAPAHSDSYSIRCRYKGGTYRSVQDCMNSTGLSRYKITQDSSFKVLSKERN